MTSKLATYLFAAAVLLSSVGCAGGAMRQSVTVPNGAADKGGLTSALDAPLAVGGEVRPSFKMWVPGSTAPATHFLSPRRDIVDVRDGLLVGKAPGLAAVLIATEGDTVIDIFHVTVSAADRLQVHGIDAAGNDLGPLSEALKIMLGDGVRLVPHVYAGPEQLAGVATSTWVVDPPIAHILHEGLPNRVRLVARSAGTAKLTVKMLGVTSSLPLKVVQ